MCQATNIHELAAAGNVDDISKAIKAGEDLNTRDSMGRTPIMVAASANRADLINQLVVRAKRGGSLVDLQAVDGGTAVMSAAAHGHTAARGHHQFFFLLRPPRFPHLGLCFL